MIKLACNYYKETEELIKENLIDIDYFKFPSLAFHMSMLYNFSEFEKFAQDVRKVKPILLHGLMPSPHNICSPNFQNELQVDLIQRLIAISGTPGISLHLDGADANMSKSQIIDVAVKNLQYLKEQIKGIDFISIENVEKSKSSYVTDPCVIKEIVNSSGVDFLLDISHAFWSSRDRKEDFKEYLHMLPLDKVYEIHLNGWEEKNGDIMAHVKINDVGYDVLNHLLEIITPKIITLEYGRENDRIGLGCPIMNPEIINIDAENEIVEQINKLKCLINIH